MPPKTKSTEPSEAEIVFARASVALAKTQRLVASWLPQKSAEELAREQQDNDEEDEEWEGNKGDELYVTYSNLLMEGLLPPGFEEYHATTAYHEFIQNSPDTKPRLGVGATPLSKEASGTLPKRKDPSLDALRKQLMGRNAPKNTASSSHRPALPVGNPQRPPQKRQSRKPDVSDSEDEAGRGGVFVSKRKGEMREKVKKAVVPADNGDGGEMEVDGDAAAAATEMQDPAPAPAPKKRKAASFMDEILAEKGAKKKKKKKKGEKSDSTN
jgi:hypothetical protein